MGFRHSFPLVCPTCKIVGTFIVGFSGQKPLASALCISCYLLSLPCVHLHPSSLCSEPESSRRPKPPPTFQFGHWHWCYLAAAHLVGNQANKYLMGIMKIDKYKVQLL